MTTILAATPQAISAKNTTSKTSRISGRILSAIPILFLVFDAAIKLAQIAPVTEAMLHLGYPVQLAPVIGIIELVCLALHLLPRVQPDLLRAARVPTLLLR